MTRPGMDAFTELQAQRPALAAWYGRMAEHVPPGRLPTDGVAYVDPRAP